MIMWRVIRDLSTQLGMKLTHTLHHLTEVCIILETDRSFGKLEETTVWRSDGREACLAVNVGEVSILYDASIYIQLVAKNPMYI